MGDLLAPAQLIELMEGNRRLTLRTIRAFPEHDLFHYSPVESMRTFAEMVRETITIDERAVRGIMTGDWTDYPELYAGITTSEGLLAACESVRRRTLEWWPGLGGKTRHHGGGSKLGHREPRRSAAGRCGERGSSPCSGLRLSAHAGNRAAVLWGAVSEGERQAKPHRFPGGVRLMIKSLEMNRAA